ncbi:Nramp family divalent metal transporter [Tautonia sociabilis]|uniref:Divalent metal cation transporter n=1 Tax=Tautonia sociabilis TaxID=2080755 RepID=A0A432MHK8_9BACT|nr:Nramp family divalent metal transporter [Tautonia sociabilis]RUL86292.1 divalent metal cation transporter [Tautonia sociabilis]
MAIPGRIRAILGSIGPGLIIASVCLGPGSVTTASKIGAEYGYMLIWVVVLASAAMMMYTAMGARFGATQSRSFLQAVADRYGRWFAVLIGLASFLMSASFQFGNNLGVTTATATITGDWASRTLSHLLGRPVVEEQVWPLVFTGAALLMVLFAKDLYRVVERVMIVLVLIMIGAFLANLVVARPDLASAAEGLVPRIPPGGGGTTVIAAMVGTTFVLHACLYQSYLVQSKGWRLPDVRKGLVDSIVGIALLATISVLIMLTSAAALKPRGIVIADAAEMALQLQAAFGPASKAIFCLGFWSAAFSSIPVNALVGGGLLADGLGLGHRMDQKWPRRLTLAIMLIGMVVAMMPQENRANALVIAQAATMLAVPAVGVGMFLMLNDRSVMGRFANSWRQNVLAGFGLVLVLVLSVATYGKLIDQIGKVRDQWRSPEPAGSTAEASPEPEPPGSD